MTNKEISEYLNITRSNSKNFNTFHNIIRKKVDCIVYLKNYYYNVIDFPDNLYINLYYKNEKQDFVIPLCSCGKHCNYIKGLSFTTTCGSEECKKLKQTKTQTNLSPEEFLISIRNSSPNFKSFKSKYGRSTIKDDIDNFLKEYYYNLSSYSKSLWLNYFYLDKPSNIKAPICPYCNSRILQYKNNIEFRMTCGYSDCIDKATKTNNLKRYGVENVAQIEENKNKIKQTCLEKYGESSFSKTEEYKNKFKQTCLERYGDEHHTKSERFQEKQRKIFYKKYGVEYNIQRPVVKEKIKETNLERYGVISTLSLNEVQDKIKQTNIERYGVYNPCMNDNIKDKLLNTFISKRNKRYDEIITKHNLKLQINHNDCLCLECNNIFSLDETFIDNRFRYYPNKVCPNCYPKNRNNISNSEIELRDFIEELIDKFNIEYNSRILEGKEIDIYIPSLRIGFEYNGVYWHSELHKPNNYHQKKSELARLNNIRLIHIWEDDWIYKTDIVKSRIRNLLRKTEKRVYARKTILKEISFNDCKQFLDENHIQGCGVGNIRYGLYYKDDLVSVIQIDSSGQLSRFANKLNTNVIGGFSKLFKYSEKYIKYTFIDLDWSDENNIYSKYMKFDSYVKPSWYLILEDRRIHRRNFQKKKLLQMGLGTPEQTEHEITLNNKLYRIYNSGNIKYVK